MKPGPKKRAAAGSANTQLVPKLPPGETAAQVEQLQNPIKTALQDAEAASDMWRGMRPLGEQVIKSLKAALNAALSDGKVLDLKLASKILVEVTSATKALGATSAAIVQSLDRLVAIKQSLDGGQANLRDLSEVQLRQIVSSVVREFAVTPVAVTAEVSASA